MFQTHPLTTLRSVIAIAALIGLNACGNSATDMDNAATALAEHYATNPPESGWTVESIIQDNKGAKLDALVVVNSEEDVLRIKMLSRMEQFTIAKLACPKMTPALQDALGKVRVWVHLQTPAKEQLTSSICPEQ
ncbi:MAG: hypothetical protein NUV50_03340 [Rhodospirillales bacterium]|nr:hypothetical protein [Rhodospirillales bacterium]